MRKKNPVGTNDPRFLIGSLIHDVSTLRRRALNDALAKLSLTQAQWWTLGNLALRGPAGTTQTELAAIMDVTKATIGVMVDKLEDGGYIERRFDAADRRIRRLHLTPLGSSIVDNMRKVVLDLTPEFMIDIGDDEIAAAYSALSKMLVNLKNMSVSAQKSR